MDALIQWGLPIVQWVQTFRTPFFDAFFPAINFLGEVTFYTALIPLLYWCIDKKIGRRFGLLFIVSTYINLYLKDSFHQPRPYEIDPKIYAPTKESSFGIPSFHTQGAVVTWGYLATQFKVRGWWSVAVILPLLIAFGRMYLGVHFPQDVIAGAAIGLVLFSAFAVYEPRAAEWFKAHTSLTIKLLVAIVLPLALAALHLTPDSGTSTGTFLGFAVGLVLEDEFVRFDAGGRLWKRVMRFALGTIILLVLQQGIKIFLPEVGLNNFIRYTVVGLWLGFGAPWVFLKAKLADHAPSPLGIVTG